MNTINQHPSLIITPPGIQKARKRVCEETWAKVVIDRLTTRAELLEKEPLPVFEKDLWKEASKKHWQDIYPEVNHHTQFAVAGPVRKAYDVSLAYAATGEPKYADLVRKVLLHYTGYEFFAIHPDCGLNWSTWLTPALVAYDIIFDMLTEQDLTEIDDFLRRGLEAIKANDEWWIRDVMGGLYNNHFAWHKLFIGSYGLFYDQAELVDYAINSEQGVRDLIENGSRDDGLWFEGSLNYHFTALQPLVQFANILANTRNAFDLWNHRFANGRCLKDLVLGPIQTAFPDLTLPTIGDTYGRRLKLDEVNLYYPAYNAYRMPEIAWLLGRKSEIPAEALFYDLTPALPWEQTEIEKDKPPRIATRIWPEHGYVALRSQEETNYWKGEGFSAFLSFDSDGIHSHRDKLGLTIFARGAHIAIDAEAKPSAEHAFSSNVQNELNRSTLCHNTVMVDGIDHSLIEKKLELLEFINAPGLKLATVADLNGLVYPGVKMKRTVAVTNEFILDVFQVSSNAEHTYDYLFHTCSDDGILDSGDGFEPINLGNKAPWTWLRNIRARPIDTNWYVSAHQDGLTTRVTMVGEPGTKLVTCEFPRDDNFSRPPISMLIVRRKAKSTIFVALIQVECGPLPEARIFVSEEKHGRIRVRINMDGETREFKIERL
ncbi:MAG: alginate lyase family protein [Armatimonadetes bacterium]|nr:alginate lyase family protein [Armatimonadota bacterium]